MNIKEVTEEIKHTIGAYLQKDEYGEYKMPLVHQRPILMIGAPGIGKTAIMEQIARELELGLASYTMTHHTRQSAIGLPLIREAQYNGTTYSVTEYTMSEIIASIYSIMEETGLKEGILFLDEINCVSETLAPAMLKLLQEKMFGSHKIPKGWVIIAAGNPSEYNKSVREFDVVTLDRVRKIEIEPNFDVWKEYAYKKQVHECILSYLNMKQENFYGVETTVDGKQFVTARGWEDLSCILQSYEEMDILVTFEMIKSYLQYDKIARDFYHYRELYEKYKEVYQIKQMLLGKEMTKLKRLNEAPLDERLSIVGLLIGSLSEALKNAVWQDEVVTKLYGLLLEYKEGCKEAKVSSEFLFDEILDREKWELNRKRKANLLEREEEARERDILKWLEQKKKLVKEKGLWESNQSFIFLKEQFNELAAKREQVIEEASNQLERAFQFLEYNNLTGQEMVIFVTELTAGYYSMEFIYENGCESYYKYNEQLLLHEKDKELKRKIENVKKLL